MRVLTVHPLVFRHLNLRGKYTDLVRHLKSPSELSVDEKLQLLKEIGIDAHECMIAYHFGRVSFKDWLTDINKCKEEMN